MHKRSISLQLKRSRSRLSGRDDASKDGSASSMSDSSDEEYGGDYNAAISPLNVGRNLLLKMGWTEGQGLGVNGSGRVEPVPFSEKRGGDLTGLGKTSQDVRTIAISTAGRKALESERQLYETEAEKDRRLSLMDLKRAQKEEIIQALQTYRCELCQKQYDRPSTFESHLNSYDHHHKKRFSEMKSLQKGKSEAAGITDKKRDNERRREEKELAKLALAGGVAMNAVSCLKSQSADAKEGGPINEAAKSTTPNSIRGGWKKVNHSPSLSKTDGTLSQSGCSANATAMPSTWKPVISRNGESEPSPSAIAEEQQKASFRAPSVSLFDSSDKGKSH